MNRRLESLGARVVRQTGSHRMYQVGQCRTIVPQHGGRDLPTGTLRADRTADGTVSREGVAAVSDRDYHVVVTREGDDWLAEVPATPPAHTFARNLEALDRYVREVIVLAEDLPDDAADGLRLSWEYHTGDGRLDKSLSKLRDQRAEVEHYRAQVEEQTAEYARRLAAADYSVRDVSALLGVSRARAQQLVSSR